MNTSLFWGVRCVHRGVFVLIFSLAFLFCACSGWRSEGERQEGFVEGKVEYRLTWGGAIVEPMLRSVLPTSMTIYFRKPHVRTEMRSLGGMATVVALVNTESGESHVLVRVMGVKSHYKEEIAQNQLSLLFDGSCTLQIPALEKRDTVFLNYECVAAEANFDDGSGAFFELLFAPGVGWEKMNQHSPFQGIAGAVLKGRMQMYGMELDVEAVSLRDSVLSDSLFMVPEGYRSVDRQALMQLLGLDILQ